MPKYFLKTQNTALILIGYQNDYFSSDGVLRSVVEENSKITHIIENTITLLSQLAASNMPVVAMPIVFSENYDELDSEPVGILKTIKEMGAFRKNSHGSNTIDELKQFGERIHYLHGKHGLNAFIGTDLQAFLVAANIKNIVLAGAVTSICIDSTARSAFERGFKVYILSDVTSARSNIEQQFYCEHIFPLYTEVLPYQQFLDRLEISSE